MSIIRSDKGDRLYQNKTAKTQFVNEFLIPDLLVNYEKPFERSNPKDVAVSTDYGRFVFLNGKSVDHFIFDIPDVEFAFADLDDVFVFTIDKDAKIEVDKKVKKVPKKKKNKKELKCEVKNEESKNEKKEEDNKEKDVTDNKDEENKNKEKDENENKTK